MHAKGAIDFLRAIPLVNQKNAQVKFIIAGDPVEREEFPVNSGKQRNPRQEIEDYVKQECLQDIVNIRDEVFGEEKLRLFSESDIFVLPSYGEGMPMVVLEAMGAGLPLIVSAVGAIPEFIKEGRNGLFVRPGDVPQLADKILLLVQDASLRKAMGEANLDLIKYNLDIRHHISAMKEAFNSVTQ